MPRVTVQDLAATRGFFGPRAAGWESRFPDDGPAYERAVAELALDDGDVVLDAACGTGRALPALRDAAGRGVVIGVDVTTEMIAAAARAGRGAVAALLLADVLALPLRAGCVDAVFAAGIVSHLPDAAAGLRSFARVTRIGGRLALFHPVGRAALARRQGRELTADDVRAPGNIVPLLERTGWQCDTVDDGEARYLVLATRR